MTSKPLVRRTLATLRNAEFGFLGVVVWTRVHTPRFCGDCCRAGTFLRAFCATRGLRINWLMVGIVSLHLPFRDAASRFSRRHTRQRRAANRCHTRRRVRKAEKPPSAQGRGPTFSVTEDHDTATFGVAAVMPSHPTVRCQRQRLSFIHRGRSVPQSRQKSLSFNDYLPNGRSDG